jgi:hypothetical protein
VFEEKIYVSKIKISKQNCAATEALKANAEKNKADTYA